MRFRNIGIAQCVTLSKILNDTDTFYRYQIFPIPIPVIFSVPNFSDTGSETFSTTKFYRYRFRDFFQYHFFPIPVPIPPKKENNCRYWELPVLGIPGTATSHSGIAKKKVGSDPCQVPIPETPPLCMSQKPVNHQ